jgi:hypothetical protein
MTETFANLLLLYCKHQYYDLAADVLAENAHLTYKFLTPELYEFLDATLGVQVGAEGDGERRGGGMGARASSWMPPSGCRWEIGGVYRRGKRTCAGYQRR